jgi:small subunit ribosomal protein S14
MRSRSCASWACRSPTTGEVNSGHVARKALIVKQQRPHRFKTRQYSRCGRCGRPRAVYKKFGLCRICLGELAHQGLIPGTTKPPW